MKITYSTKPKISISLLYLFTLLTTTILSAGEKNLGSQFLDLYFHNFDKFNPYNTKSVFKNPFDFVSTTGIFNNIQNIIHSKNALISNLEKYKSNLEIESKSNTDNSENNIQIMNSMGMCNEIIEGNQNILYVLQRVNPNIYIPTRYNNIDSYLWNSLTFDFNNQFEKIEPGEGKTHFFYPSSMISVPRWFVPGVKMDLWMNPYEISRTEYDDFEFIAISAPFHHSMILNDSKKLPKVQSLSNVYLEESNSKYLPNINDLNMIYFFKMIYDHNINIVIAICSDPSDQQESGDSFTFNFSENMGVMNKCHLYWRISFKIHMFKDCLLYTSPSPRDLSTSRMPSSA